MLLNSFSSLLVVRGCKSLGVGVILRDVFMFSNQTKPAETAAVHKSFQAIVDSHASQGTT